MVTFTDKITYLPVDGLESKENEYRNTRVAERIEGLRLKYKELIPEELETRFILEGRVKKDTTIDDLTITPMENVSEELWDKLQFILP